RPPPDPGRRQIGQPQRDQTDDQQQERDREGRDVARDLVQALPEHIVHRGPFGCSWPAIGSSRPPCSYSTSLTYSTCSQSTNRCTVTIPPCTTVMTPSGNPGGKTPPWPEVTIRSPTVAARSPGTYFSTMLFELSPWAMARSRVRSTKTGMLELTSVSSRMRAARSPTSDTRPIRPSPVMATWFLRTPSLLPAATRMLRTKAPPLPPTTRAVTNRALGSGVRFKSLRSS